MQARGANRHYDMEGPRKLLRRKIISAPGLCMNAGGQQRIVTVQNDLLETGLMELHCSISRSVLPVLDAFRMPRSIRTLLGREYKTEFDESPPQSTKETLATFLGIAVRQDNEVCGRLMRED
jgi:hypothetical protein